MTKAIDQAIVDVYTRGSQAKLLAAGMEMVGGCCGTTPDYIAAFRTLVERWNAFLVFVALFS